MKVKVKSKKDIMKIFFTKEEDYYLKVARLKSNVPFVSDMFKYCNKGINIIPYKTSFFSGKCYVCGSNNFIWADYMFEVKDKQYELEFK